MKTVELSLCKDYVSHWSEWEAVREILQNAIDNGAYTALTHSNALRIKSYDTKLPLESLLLGKSSKAGDDSQIGKFGEGYKLALLILCTMGYKVKIINANEIWVPRLATSAVFGVETLHIDIVEGSKDSKDLIFIIEGLTLEQFSSQFKPDMPIGVPVSDNPGDIYVSGLFVGNQKGFQYSYNLSPSQLQLDRDRRMVPYYDLAFQTSLIWTGLLDTRGDTVLDLMEKKAPDVEYVEYHAQRKSVAATSIYGSYSSRYGSAIPVSNQDEINRAVAAGVKFQLVPAGLKNILWKLVGYVIPSKGTPKQKLEKFLDKYRSVLSVEQTADLKEIIGDLDAAQ